MFGKITASSVEGLGNAVSNVVGTIWGSRSDKDTAIHDEQMAILAEFAAEFAGRPPKTWWDSFVDGLNRLPRPMITFGLISVFLWAFYDPAGFVGYMSAMEVVPDELWIMWLSILAFWFGGRLVSQDLRKPKVTKEQLDRLKEILTKLREPVDAKSETPTEVLRESLPASPQDGTNVLIDSMIDALIAREGGYVNHPADRGGPTNCGITRETLAAWRECSVTEDDVKCLTPSEAAEIYRASYYFAPGIDTLPPALQAHVFDIAVNSGPRAGIKLLQRALNRLNAGIKEDGVLGPVTRAAAAAYPASDINRTLVEVRLRYYDDIVAADPKQRVFIDGWRKRAKSFLTA
jgi:hypothetical protein